MYAKPSSSEALQFFHFSFANAKDFVKRFTRIPIFICKSSLTEIKEFPWICVKRCKCVHVDCRFFFFFLHWSLANYKQLLEYSRKSGSPELQMHMHSIMRIHEEGRRTSVLVVLFLAAVIPVFRHLQSLRNGNMILASILFIFFSKLSLCLYQVPSESVREFSTFSVIWL